MEEHPYLTGSKALVRLWRTLKVYRYVTDLFCPPRRRDSAMGVAGRIAWLEAGWYENFGKAESAEVDHCDPCSHAYCDTLSGYIGGFSNRIHF